MILESKRLRQVTVVASFFAVIGAVTWLYFLGSSDGLPWGSFVTNFIYFLGVTQGALAIVVVLRVSSATWGPPFFRIASAIALAFFPIALIMLFIIFIGENSIFFWAKESHHPYFSSSFFFSRNLIAFLAFYALALVIFNTSMSNNFKSKHSVVHRSIMVGLFLLIVFSLHQTIVSWDFGMTLNRDWTSTVYGIYFMVGSLYAGTAGIVVISSFVKRFFKVDFVPENLYVNFGHLLLALSVLWIYHWWSNFFPMWYGNLPEEVDALYLPIFSAYGATYGWMMALTAVVPFLSLLFMKVRKSVTALTTVSIIILIGVWLNRYLTVVPSLVKEETSIYTPVFGFTNLAITLGTLGGFLLLFFMILKRYPRVLASKETEPEDMFLSEPQGW